jgi:hypothetical protein
LFDLQLIPEFTRAQPNARAELCAMLRDFKLPVQAAFR